jgi:kynureninase
VDGISLMPQGMYPYHFMTGMWTSPFFAPTNISIRVQVVLQHCSSTKSGTKPKNPSTHTLSPLEKLESQLNISCRFAGWWGHELESRFAMPPKFSPIRGAQGFQQSNPSALTVASLYGALTVIKKAGMMQPLRERSLQLTGALEKLLRQSKYFVAPSQISKNGTKIGFTIITPEEPSARGAQLSLLFLPLESETMRIVHDYLSRSGVIGDERQPDVIRLAPAPLYNTLKDCQHAAEVLETAFIFAENA